MVVTKNSGVFTINVSEELNTLGGSAKATTGYHRNGQEPEPGDEFDLDAENNELDFDDLEEGDKIKITLSAEGKDDIVQRFEVKDGELVEVEAPAATAEGTTGDNKGTNTTDTEEVAVNSDAVNDRQPGEEEKASTEEGEEKKNED